jgi:nitrite reductase/ring-hydroxylating ferredoxin subunit
MVKKERRIVSAPERIVIPLTRRGFCGIAAKCAVAGLASCMMGDDKLIAIGSVGGEEDAGSGNPGHPDARGAMGAPDGRAPRPDAPTAPRPDASTAPRPDASTAPSPDAAVRPDASWPDAPWPDAPWPDAPWPDAPTGPACGGGEIAVGAPSSFAEGTATYFSTYRLYVARDAGGLYAMSARCTHQGTAVQDKGSYFYCPSHGARFDMNGGVISGPTSTPLPHYAMCVRPSGDVAVDTSQTVSPDTRLAL